MQKKKTAEAQIQQELNSEPVRSIGAAAWPVREPMTGTQAASLKRLAEELREPSAYDAGLTRSEASRRIYRLEERIRLGQLPPHTD